MRELDREEIDDVVVRVTQSEGKDFDAGTVELRIDSGSWLPTDVVAATEAGVARVGALVDGSTLTPGAHRLRVKVPDGPRVVLVEAGTLYVT